MKHILTIPMLVLFAGTMLFISCKKELYCEGCGDTNKAPIPVAGPDHLISLPPDSILLDGSASSDPDGSISNYLWTTISGPASFIIVHSTKATTTVKNLVAGVYQFELKVTDNGGLSAKDTLQVRVNDPSQSNLPPIANAGADKAITLPTNMVTIDGSGSSDPENNITSYTWTKISGPSPADITSPTVVQTQVTGLVQGVYQFELKVADAGGLFSKDTVTIRVNSTNNQWTQLQQLPANEFFFGPRLWFGGSNFFMGIDNKLFAISNHGGLWQYNEQSNNWSRIGNFPEQMTTPPIVFAVNGKGYCIADKHCWQYDPATNKWTRKNDPPALIANYWTRVNFILNGKVYLVDETRLYVYDASADTYIQKNALPGSAATTGFVINGEGYCIAGAGECWKYNVSTDTWLQKASLPQGLSSLSGFSINNSGYVIGDFNGSAYNLNHPMQVWRYDSTLDKWERSADYRGWGVYELNTVSFNGIAYVGIGYNNADFNAIDFWSFN